MVANDLGARGLELFEIAGFHPATPDPVHDDMDGNAGTGPCRERVGEL